MQLFGRHVQIRNIHIVHNIYRFNDAKSCGRRQQQWKQDARENTDVGRSVDHCALIQLRRNFLDELQEDENLQQIGSGVNEERRAERIIQTEALDDLKPRDFRRVEGNDHGDDEHAHDYLLEAKIETIQNIGRHRAENRVQDDADQDEYARIFESDQHVSFFERRLQIIEAPNFGQSERGRVH